MRESVITMNQYELLDFYESKLCFLIEHVDNNKFGTMLKNMLITVEMSKGNVSQSLQGQRRHLMNVFLTNVQYLLSIIRREGGKLISVETARSIIHDVIKHLHATREQMRSC